MSVDLYSIIIPYVLFQPFVVIVSYRRSRTSVEEYGGNEDFAWKYDSSAIVIKVENMLVCCEKVCMRPVEMECILMVTDDLFWKFEQLLNGWFCTTCQLSKVLIALHFTPLLNRHNFATRITSFVSDCFDHSSATTEVLFLFSPLFRTYNYVIWLSWLSYCWVALVVCHFCAIQFYIIIRVRSEFSLVASCVLLKYTRTDDVNWWRDLI